MKHFLFTMFCLLACSAHVSYATLAKQQCRAPKPEKVAWIVTVDEIDLGYCYSGPDKRIGFFCDVNGEIAKVGSRVLGYTDAVVLMLAMYLDI